ncbi:MAG: hypothetical protein GX442_07985 [Candidatus Riflebacteria bacterium]|nr:hypothetical protein [Candidatus Riflebacteria bacterium]
MGKRLFSLATDPYLADHQLEGTPFVPFVVLAESLLELVTDGVTPVADGGLADLRLEAPLMLRKGREREVEYARTPTRFEARDGAGRPLFSATAATGRHSLAGPPPRATTPPVLAWPRRNLYPAILRHGPTFQADLQVWRFSPAEAVFAWTGIAPRPASLACLGPDRAAACVLGDLALQAAGLTLLGRGGGYTLPWGAAGYERPVPLVGAGPTDTRSAMGPGCPGRPPAKPGSRLAAGPQADSLATVSSGVKGPDVTGMPEQGAPGMPERVPTGVPGSDPAAMPLPELDRQPFPGETYGAAAATGLSGITCRVTTASDGKLTVETFTADGRALICWLGLDLRPVGISISGSAQGLIEALAALQEVAA